MNRLKVCGFGFAIALGLVGGASPPLRGDEANVASPAKVPAKWLKSLPRFLREGKFNINARLRYEFADQDGIGGVGDLKPANAPTLRTRVGYTTGEVNHFRSMLEFENVHIIGNPDNFNRAGLNPKAADKTVVADPEATELNRAWIAYDNWDTLVKFGRQRISLDNERFVGPVGWRQNEQTFDGVSVVNDGLLTDTSLFYSYIWNVNRVVGDDHPAGNFQSNIHLIHIAYEGFKWGTLVGYTYLLDLENAPRELSSATFGGSFVGGVPVTDTIKLSYRAEVAHQRAYKGNDIDAANYFHVNLGGSYKKTWKLGAGYEVLGSKNGHRGFSTPLATLHAMNGFADRFLTTPKLGLEDVYVWLGAVLPGKIPVKALYHHFSSEEGHVDFGDEVDLVASRRINKYFTALVKYALYEDGDGPPFPVDKFWAQLEFNY